MAACLGGESATLRVLSPPRGARDRKRGGIAWTWAARGWLVPCGTGGVSEITIDLAERWRRARRAALTATVAPRSTIEGDEELLARALQEDRKGALRRVFDNSLRLGTSFARYHDHELSLEELPALLPQLGAPCLSCRYRPCETEPALFLEQSRCDAATLGAGACDWWKEAIEGLVLGVTGGIFYTRHASAGHGGGVCVGVLYIDPESPLRFGPIPEVMREALEGVRRTARTFHSSLDVEFLGMNEGVLFYRIRRRGCDETPLNAQSLVERGIHRRFPGVVLREVSERSVLGADGAN